jgi:hypothetical protein
MTQRDESESLGHPRPDIEAIHMKLTAAAYAVADAQELARECVPRLDHTTWVSLHAISVGIAQTKRYLDQEPDRVGL